MLIHTISIVHDMAISRKWRTATSIVEVKLADLGDIVR